MSQEGRRLKDTNEEFITEAESNNHSQLQESVREHKKMTRSRHGIFKPKQPYDGLAQTSERLEPTYASEALKITHWKQAMDREFLGFGE